MKLAYKRWLIPFEIPIARVIGRSRSQVGLLLGGSRPAGLPPEVRPSPP